jgi:hypothetical protein
MFKVKCVFLFVGSSGIVDHHCLNFLFIIQNCFPIPDTTAGQLERHKTSTTMGKVLIEKYIYVVV